MEWGLRRARNQPCADHVGTPWSLGSEYFLDPVPGVGTPGSAGDSVLVNHNPHVVSNHTAPTSESNLRYDYGGNSLSGAVRWCRNYVCSLLTRFVHEVPGERLSDFNLPAVAVLPLNQRLQIRPALDLHFFGVPLQTSIGNSLSNNAQQHRFGQWSGLAEP